MSATTILTGFCFSGLPAARRRLVACVECRRALSGSATRASGHNRWSKIRHDKGAADAKKTAMRSNFTKSLTMYSQMYGPDVSINSQLASVVAAAKKAGVPKAIIEGAIARGQGRSADGAKLEHFTYEIMMSPSSVALLVDLETDSKARTLQDLNALVRRAGGTSTATKFLFTRRGRAVLDPRPAAAETAADASSDTAGAPSSSSSSSSSPHLSHISPDDVLEDAIEAGAEDIEQDEDNNIVIWTPPQKTAAVVQGVALKHDLPVLSAETIWDANEDTRAPIANDEDLRKLIHIVTTLRTYPDVRAIYSNAAQGTISDDDWQQLDQELDW